MTAKSGRTADHRRIDAADSTTLATSPAGSGSAEGRRPECCIRRQVPVTATMSLEVEVAEHELTTAFDQARLVGYDASSAPMRRLVAAERRFQDSRRDAYLHAADDLGSMTISADPTIELVRAPAATARGVQHVRRDWLAREQAIASPGEHRRLAERSVRAATLATQVLATDSARAVRASPGPVGDDPRDPAAGRRGVEEIAGVYAAAVTLVAESDARAAAMHLAALQVEAAVAGTTVPVDILRILDCERRVRYVRRRAVELAGEHARLVRQSAPMRWVAADAR